MTFTHLKENILSQLKETLGFSQIREFSSHFISHAHRKELLPKIGEFVLIISKTMKASLSTQCISHLKLKMANS